MKKSFFTLAILFVTKVVITQTSFSLNTSQELLENPITKTTLVDVQELLEKACNCPVSFENQSAEIQITLPKPSLEKFDKIKHQNNSDGIPNFYYPNSSFTWDWDKKDNQYFLNLDAKSFEGISSGLYALLQEKMGFRFYHPRKTIIPVINKHPLPEKGTWNVKERFNKRGFHLHTMHPLELTEALLDENFTSGQEEIKEYINWLARNGQNYFEFNLLNSIKEKTWIPYAKEFVDYGHQRGIIMGLDISLNMVQQKAYKLYKKFPKKWKSKNKQIFETLNQLNQADFDVYNIEMSSTEYNSGNSGKRHQLMLDILEWANQNQVKIMGRAHVVKKGEAVLNYTGETSKVHDSERGVMIHTVMFYEINDEKAPVYGSLNLKHMNDLLLKEQKQRETWYFPESAYWITFDNSIPMFLMPYLSARKTDIEQVYQQGIEGHLTFSSGWEWGYWLFDWSIARWSWDYGYESDYMETISQLIPDSKAVNLFKNIHDLQDEYFKEKELMRYLTAQSVLDEVPKKFSKEFQPRPRWRYPYLFKKANKLELDSFYNEGIIELEKYVGKTEPIIKTLKNHIKDHNLQSAIMEEWVDGLDITLLRVKHRISILKSIYFHRLDKIEKKEKTYLQYVDEAEKIRIEALAIVKKREKEYHYDAELLSTKRKGHTAYHFGYLYPVSNLHFWYREEMQVRKNKWGFPFMNIWNIWRIMGVVK